MENINLKIGCMSKPEKAKQNRRLPIGPMPNTEITLAKVIEHIRHKGFPLEQEQKLIAAASATPHGALFTFVKNLKKYLNPGKKKN